MGCDGEPSDNRPVADEFNSTMSTNNVSDDASIDELSGIGPARAESLGVDTVSELAESSAQHLFNESDLSAGEVEDAVNAAREAVGETMEATVYTDDPQDPEPEAAEESFGDDVDSFVEAGGSIADGLVPEECETIAILAGDGVFDPDGKHGDMDAEEMAQLVQHRLVEFGFDSAEQVIALGSGMGRTAVNAWAQYTKNETDQELPALGQISVDADGAYPSSDDYRERNQSVLEAVDGVCVVANGDYVGMWVNMVRERPNDDVIIRTPELDDE